jgi:hypothetical protein
MADARIDDRIPNVSGWSVGTGIRITRGTRIFSTSSCTACFKILSGISEVTDSVLASCKTQKDFCSPENALFPHYCLLVEKQVIKPWHKT